MTDEPDDTVPKDFAEVFPESGWPDLRGRVLLAGAIHELDPSTPLVKIGEFDAMVCIGEGGWGIVFKARDPKLGRLVALKLCRIQTPELIQAIEKEAQALAQLDHPNIVPVYGLGEHEGAPFFVMPYMAGRNATDFARREPRPTWRQIVRIYCGVAKGLAAAHRRGIVHGDVKPSNFLLDLDDVARIADFGLAWREIEEADESEQEGLLHRAGTIYYAAPEVLRGERGDARSDQFSFFVALAQTLEGGKLPFRGESSGELLENIERTQVQFKDPTIPQALMALVRIGLSEDPSERFPNMNVVAAELERVLLESEGPELAPIGGPAPSMAKRGVMLLASVVLAVGLVLGWLGRARVESASPASSLGEIGELGITVLDHRGWTGGLASYARALQAIDRGDVRASYDAWVSARIDMRHSFPRLDGELSLLLAERVAARHPGRAVAVWMADDAADSFEKAQSWHRAVKARHVAAEFADAANDVEEAAEQERCALINATGRPC